ncbi:NAD-dependent epimerase/dehydratase family protein [Haloprofundus marisrubri]|uniref:NAD-dependent epimerase/dehydratase family protein n=1 Tax=Haloprofundus marisrubri TaxID=1514971 RepID=UPI0008F9284E|nr:NAD(P)-dependent oxidoreductase [Haloprofundus marisrubri]
MKVFITGATGVLGRRLVAQLTTHGHEVVGLVRDDAGADLVEQNGAIARYGDVLDPETLRQAIDDDTEVIVHAATVIPRSPKPSKDEWAQNGRVRKTGMQNLLETAPSELKQVLFPSVVWVARQPDGSWFDETADRYPDRATQSAAEVERLLQSRAAVDDFEAVILRCGFFYAADARDTRLWGEKLLEGELPIVGGGLLGQQDAKLSFVHVDDAASAFVAAIEANANGLYHVVDDEPVSGAAFFERLAELLDAPEPRRIPGWLARLFIGKVNVNGFTSPMPTTNEKIKTELDWQPAYPSFEEGLKQVVESWQTNGTVTGSREESITETKISI